MSVGANDFRVIEAACVEQLEFRLREDERNGPDFQAALFSKKLFTDMDSMLYREPDSLQRLSRDQHYSLPPAFARYLGSFNEVDMTLLPELQRVAIIGDNRLWLWDYLSPDVSGIEEVPGFGGDLILCVALAAPKPGLFLDDIKYLLAVATDVDMVLVALQILPQQADSVKRIIRPIQTAFRLSLDDLICKKIVSTQHGRIFVGGHNGVLFEIEYDHITPWSSLIGFGADNVGDANLTKCQKRKHGLWSFSPTNILPSFISNPDDRMEDMVADNVRNLVHTIVYSTTSMLGMGSSASLQMYSLFLGPKGRQQKFGNNLIRSAIQGEYISQAQFDLFEQARSFCRNQAGAYAGMESNTRAPPQVTQGPFPPFSDQQLEYMGRNGARVVVGLDVLPLTESSRVHVVVTLAHGYRLYLRINGDGDPYTLTPAQQAAASSGRHNGPPSGPKSYLCAVSTPPAPSWVPISEQGRPPDFHATWGSNDDARVYMSCIDVAPRPNSIELVAIRPPPDRSDLPDPPSAASSGGKSVIHGANKMADRSRVFELNRAMHASGLFVASTKDIGAAKPSLLGLSRDIKQRDINQLPPNNLEMPKLREPSVREGLCQLDIFQPREEVMDIRECAMPLVLTTKGTMSGQLLSLFATSRTPDTNDCEFYRAPQLRFQGQLKPEDSVAETPLLPSQFLSPAGRPLGTGAQRNAYFQVTTLNELAQQHVPASSFSLQRQILVLSRIPPAPNVADSHNVKVYALRKRRPVDFLYEKLATNDQRGFEQMCNEYGAVDFCAMCWGLSCGLPADAGDTATQTDDPVLAPPQISEKLRFLAVKEMLVVVKKHLESWRTAARRAASMGPVGGLPGGIPADVLAACANDPTLAADVAAALNGTGDVAVKNPMIQGLAAVASRILRPVWLRMISMDYKEPSAKRSPLCWFWSTELIASILVPLRRLISSIRFSYPAEIALDPTSKVNLTSLFPVNMGGGAVMGGFGGAGVSVITRDQVNYVYSQIESLAICKLYRLLSRAEQALQLIRLILVAEREWKWRDWKIKSGGGKVETWSEWVWGKQCFSGVTLRRFVVNAETHSHTAAFLTSLLSETERHRDAAREKVDLFTESLDRECFMFYGAGDRKTTEAKKELAKLRDMTAIALGHSRAVQEQAVLAIASLKDAAKYWRTEQRVKGGDLESCCAELFAQGDDICLDGLVDICWLAAENFRDRRLVNPLAGRNLGQGADGRERLLYHGGEETDPVKRKDRRTDCFRTLLDYAKKARSLRPANAGPGAAPPNDAAMARIVRHAVRLARECKDVDLQQEFESMLCTELLTPATGVSGRMLFKSQLLELPDRFVEEHLRRWDDREKWDTLYEWFAYHQHHQRAAEVMYQQAVVDYGDNQFDPMEWKEVAKHKDDLTSIDARIRYLKLAVASAALMCASTAYGGGSNPQALEIKARYDERLLLAEIQKDVLGALQNLSAVSLRINDFHGGPLVLYPLVPPALANQGQLANADLYTKLNNNLLGTKAAWTALTGLTRLNPAWPGRPLIPSTYASLIDILQDEAQRCFLLWESGHITAQIYGNLLKLYKTFRDHGWVKKAWKMTIYR